MSDTSDPDDEAGQALVATNIPAETALDAHGHDPARYEWIPVLRKPRSDGSFFFSREAELYETSAPSRMGR